MLSDLPQTALIVPCFNEEHRLAPDAFVAALTTRPCLKIYFVDDGSTDATLELLQDSLASSHDRVKIIALPGNQGKAAAVRAGVLQALKDGAKMTGFWDADLATPLEELDNFLDAIKRPGIELVMGCRVLRLGADVRRRAIRHYPGRVFATIVSRLLALPVYDTQCGAKLMTSSLAESVFAEPFVSRWLFDVEILKRVAALRGAEACRQAVFELPLTTWHDVGGSKLSVTQMLRTPLELFRVFF